MKLRDILNLPPDGLASVPKKDRPQIRQGLLTAAGKNVDDLAAAANKCPGYIRMIISDERTGYTIRPIIAQILGYRVVDLWPDTPEKYRRAA